jgi:hypothetical protein
MSKETESLALKYDYIVRFNIGSNPRILEQYDFYNGKTDLCCLSGWSTENFGDIEGFVDKAILFSRPKCHPELKYFFKDICVNDKFHNKMLTYTKSLFYIEPHIFNQFCEEYKYDHPTTGLIILYYMKKSLSLNVDCINFFIDDDLYNHFGGTGVAYHKIQKERKILESLNIRNILC